MITTFSCNKESVNENATETTEPSDNMTLIKISGDQTPEATKTTLNGVVTSWVANTDKVGIYSPEARAQTGGAGTLGIINAQFTAVSSGLSSNFTGTMYWGAAGAQHAFYSYYPFKNGSSASNVVPLSLPAVQTQLQAGSTAHLGALDFLVATPVTVSSPASTGAIANEVNLRYNHLYTVIEFHIKGNTKLKAVRLIADKPLAIEARLDISQPTPAAGVAYNLSTENITFYYDVAVTLTNEAVLSNTQDTKVYMVINPSAPTSDCQIGISVDGIAWKYISKAAPNGGFKRGKKYVVEIDANAAMPISYNEVTSTTTGRVWMDRNLGALRVATSIDDALAYGDLYQWGRGSDGHEKRTSMRFGGAVDSDSPNNGGLFIYGSYTPWYDWREPQNPLLWQGVNGINNPCPEGFRLPTYQEWYDEIFPYLQLTADINNIFENPLKLTLAGYRSSDNAYLKGLTPPGIIQDELWGTYWSSTIGTTTDYGDGSPTKKSYAMGFNKYTEYKDTDDSTDDWVSLQADIIVYYGSTGCSVRCIKD